VVATNYADRRSVVSWSAPISNGGNAIDGYKVVADLVGSTPNAVTFSGTNLPVSGAGTERHVNYWSGAGYVTYTFTVPAGSSSLELTFTNGSGEATRSITLDDAPWIESQIFPTAGNWSTKQAVSLEDVYLPAGTHKIRVSSSEAQGPLNLYGLAISTGSATSVCWSVTTSCTMTNLTNGASYRFKVFASNNAGSGPASSFSTTITPASVPDLPTAVEVALNDSGVPVISWDAPDNTGGAPITSYRIIGFNAGATIGTVTCTPITETSCLTTGLTIGASYTFFVTARNAAGLGSQSF
jgi:titin